MDTLENVARLVASCTDCPLHVGRSNAVPGEGPPDAELLFIGEGPGFHEDRQGRPFVGPAGNFLESLLESIGMTRDQVFIANMVKCRPPDNRDPTPAEIGACSKYLDRQIELIDPRLIVTLGRFSTARFLPGQSISRVRGRLRQSNGRHVFPIMHPAAGLRRQEMRQAIEEDFAKVPGLLDVLRMEGSQPANPGRIRESTHPYLPSPPRHVPVQSSLFGDPVPPSELLEEATDRSDPVRPPSDEPPSGQPPPDEPPSGQPRLF